MKGSIAKNKRGRRWFDGRDYVKVLAGLVEAWSSGCPDSEAAAFADISTSSLCRFLKAHIEVAEQRDRLRLKPLLIARVTLLKQIQGGDGDLSLKFLERKLPKEFSTRQELGINEPDRFAELTDSQLADIALGKKTLGDFIK